jgi:hypothetical protein
MHSVTLDTNCLIDVEQGGKHARAILALVARHRAGVIDLRLPAISASERQPGGRHLANFTEFQARVDAAGLGGLRLIEPLAYTDMTFWDSCVLGDDATAALERRIHEVLFPGIQFLYTDYCRARGLDPEVAPPEGKWRNAKCDVLVAWSHIHHGGEILVTNDSRFHKATKKPLLTALGIGTILRPEVAEQTLGAGSGPTKSSP